MQALNALTPEGHPAPTILDLYRGVTEYRDQLAPIVVGFVRGLAEAVLLAGFEAGIVFADAEMKSLNLDLPLWALIGGPVGLQAANTIRGFIDQIDPRKQRAIRARE